jgi:hypothetical protein
MITSAARSNSTSNSASTKSTSRPSRSATIQPLTLRSPHAPGPFVSGASRSQATARVGRSASLHRMEPTMMPPVLARRRRPLTAQRVTRSRRTEPGAGRGVWLCAQMRMRERSIAGTFAPPEADGGRLGSMPDPIQKPAAAPASGRRSSGARVSCWHRPRVVDDIPPGGGVMPILLPLATRVREGQPYGARPCGRSSGRPGARLPPSWGSTARARTSVGRLCSAATT